jgi:hypothetical protein
VNPPSVLWRIAKALQIAVVSLSILMRGSLNSEYEWPSDLNPLTRFVKKASASALFVPGQDVSRRPIMTGSLASRETCRQQLADSHGLHNRSDFAAGTPCPRQRQPTALVSVVDV